MTAKYILIPVLLLALSVTYAGFSDTLFIGTANVPNTVTTTDMEWSTYGPTSCYDGMVTAVFNPFDPSSLADDNYATLSCSVDDVRDGKTTITVTVTNAYPAYAFGVDTCIQNTGNLPSKLRDVVIDAPDSLKNSAKVAYALKYSLNGQNNVVYKSNKDLSFADFESEIETELAGKVFTNGGYICLGDENSHTLWIYFPPNSNPPQGETLKFNITFVFGQFNE
ncbi:MULTISPECIES: hypothetical protein [Archaeoglobus]|uniref:Uncharacterized protein n=1 Tax=Archaeoglobus fulgidus TaxID=2234 RepID=A0A101E2L9_ARCFL|nr:MULTISPECIES: hypothetical protein [Archaeoglobus]KUJ94589.1 MAG: hypothetical protein XD40_0153 [Archaeoglobus fulgidus]KUK07507.1 MAG: hypothetical protein XD48_0286 [Archaeoglobus fulgidus]MDI3498670.1 hypothetical protein [Archaeoglobus sp.]